MQEKWDGMQLQILVVNKSLLLMIIFMMVLMIDRPYWEWFWDDLIPMEHYVPIRADLSDLREKIEYLNEHPEKYKDICKKARLFSETHF